MRGQDAVGWLECLALRRTAIGKGRGVEAVKGVIQDKTQASFTTCMGRIMSVYPY